MRPGGTKRPPADCQGRCSCRSVAVEVGFEPTEDLRLHTLSSTAHHCSPPSVSVRTSADVGRADAGERWRTGVNETKTETTGWHARVPRSGRRPVNVAGDLLAARARVYLVVADSERTADCVPFVNHAC